ncbi:MAG: hypothetical protein K6T91_01965 [Firmicutes bacterium]|nr:hypothetical protein [Bacillota bacterium]
MSVAFCSPKSYWGEKIARIKNPIIKKYFPFFLVAGVALAVALTAYYIYYPTASQVQLPKKYSDSYISFSHPRSWMQVKPEEAGYKAGDSKVLKVFTDGLRKTFLVYVVKENNFKAPLDYKAVEKEIRSSYETLYPGTKIVSTRPYKIDGKNGLEISMEYKVKNSVFNKTQYVTSTSSYVYWITITSTTEKTDTNREIMYRILDTVKLKPH